jgi:predicted DNA binding protein
VELGYYDEPRQASLEDISDVVGIRPGTVGEHLRKAKYWVSSKLVPVRGCRR